ncbi:MAG: 30S ribosomal protein S12 methylthiotransferase RimO [Deltaproteobacteria bacterium]|nr:30S ribosomal protein S12 methylthiotransferase RimO [Deltaproteobacteria bacterium]
MSDAPKASVHFRSLGCAKNLLDTEVMLGSLATRGYAIAESLEDADVAVVNTCSFIDSAREESVQAILEVADLRESGRLRGLVVAGCMPQRYGAALAKELPEVDAFVGTGAFQDIADILDDALAGRGRGVYVEAGRTHLYDDRAPRILTGAGHSAYVKIAEGCDRVCAFCAIPGIRGKFQSRRLESVVSEVQQLASLGVREINLVAQDSTSYGKDLAPREGAGRPKLADLVRALDASGAEAWIRLLYLYPSAVTADLIGAISGAKRVLPYVDVPLQHASDSVLAAMKRGTTGDRQRRLVEKLRAQIPQLTLRTTFVVGFPGETDDDFTELLEFVRWARFDRVGVFRYSDEEGTAGADLPNKVPRKLARERYRALTKLQASILAEKLTARVGETDLALVDAAIGRDKAQARLASQAPEIDGVTFVRGKNLRAGDLVRVRITGAKQGVDLEADAIEIVRAAESHAGPAVGGVAAR